LHNPPIKRIAPRSLELARDREAQDRLWRESAAMAGIE
jgi:hypothetical protein